MIFQALGWENPAKIDLYLMSQSVIKNQRINHQVDEWTESDKGHRPSPLESNR